MGFIEQLKATVDCTKSTLAEIKKARDDMMIDKDGGT